MGKYEKKPEPRVRNHQAPSRYGNGQSAPHTQAQQGMRKKKKKNPLGILLIVLLCCIFVVGIGFFVWKFLSPSVQKLSGDKIRENVYVAGVNVGGLTKDEAKEKLTGVSLDYNLTVNLYTKGTEFKSYTTTFDPSTVTAVDIYGKPLENAQQTVAIPHDDTPPADPDAPLDENGEPYQKDVTLTLPAENVRPTLDVDAAVSAAYAVGRSTKEGETDRVDIVSARCLKMDETYVRDLLTACKEEHALEGNDTKIEKDETTINDKDGNPKRVECINITVGSVTRTLNVDNLYEKIAAAYLRNEPSLQAIYDEELPKPCDLDKLFKEYNCVDPVNAVCDEETFEITDGKDGYGFRMMDAIAAFEKAQAGETVTLTLQTLEPQFSRKTLEEQLFVDVLSSYDSPHVWNPTRTHNLELACAAFNGYIVKPGATFSFNEVVGERTADKGYGEAGVYVGGRTEQQLGGGVCQVASTLFYCTLKADLEVVERAEHQFTPSYIPWGMDATIYWGSLDYKFRNNTAFPIRIDASVSDGYVHIRFVGTNTKEYTVKLDYVTTAYFPAEQKTIDISPDMRDYYKYQGYAEGDVIQTAYDGANVTTYRYKYDKNGDLISTEIVCYSKYDRRDREIAHIVKDEEPTTEPPTTEPPTQPSTEPPTAPPTEPPTAPPTEPPTAPPTEVPTTPPTEVPTEVPTVTP